MPAAPSDPAAPTEGRSPSLHRLDLRGSVPPSGVVLMLHGGQERSHQQVDATSASFQRSRWMQRRIGGRLRARGAAVWLLRYHERGWNAGAGRFPSPVQDARWALDEVRREVGEVPVVLLGHSMGARTAVAVADHGLVTGVVALAAWLPPGEPVGALGGRRFAAAHGRADRVTSFSATAAFVRRAGSVARSAELEDMGDAGHYMFRREQAWNDFAASRTLSFLADAP